ncbi:MAG: biotin--[acetyl-CoA-carboxylase] ligase [Coriobacteriia bacterium]|nr:biotin--[acetyl-CoA-carboxylase] ligase [Coriobacteriia bacterium]
MDVERLTTQLEGVCQLIALDSVTSTNDEILVQAQAHRFPMDQPLVVISQTQTAGRGRLGRNWASPAGGLYLSVLLELSAIKSDASAVASLSPLVALALREALQGFSASELRIKWPNDILAPTGKLVGILIELKPASAVFGARVADSTEQFAVIGMGVNVWRPATGAGTSEAAYLADGHAGSLPLEDVVTAMLKTLLRRFAAWQAASGSFAGFLVGYMQHMAQLGETVCVRNALGDEVEHGIVTGIDEQGRLVLATPLGDRAIAAGEVSLRDL